jgi:hypothetical protein
MAMTVPQETPTSGAPPIAKPPDTKRTDFDFSDVMLTVLGAMEGRHLASQGKAAIQVHVLLESLGATIGGVAIALALVTLVKVLWARFVGKRRPAWREVVDFAKVCLLIAVAICSLQLATWLVGGWPTVGTGMCAGGALGLMWGLVLSWWRSRTAYAGKGPGKEKRPA